MVQVPRFTSVDLQPISMPQVQAPRVMPMDDQRPREIMQQAEAVQQLGQAGIRYGMYEQRKAQQLQNQLDDAATNEAFSQFYDFSVEQMSGKDVGYQYKVGKAAAEAYEPTRKAVKDKFTEIENSLGNDVQKQMVRMKAGRYATGVYADMDSHYEKSVKAHDMAQSEVLARNYGEIAIQNYQSYLREQDPERKAAFLDSYNRFKQGMLSQVNRVADMTGMPVDDPIRQDQLQKASDALHAQMVDSLLANRQPGDAINYLEKNRGELSVGVQAKLQDQITRVSVVEQATQASLAVRGAGTLSQRQNALTEMYKDKKLSADAYQDAKRMVAYDYNIDVEEASRVRAEGLNEVAQWAYNNPRKPLSMAPTKILTTVNNLGITAEANKMITAMDEQSYSDALNGVRSMLASDDGRKQLANMTENDFAVQYMPRMNSADFAYAKARHATARGNPTIEQVSLVSVKDRVLKAAFDTKTITTKTATTLTQEDRLKLINFEMEVEAALKQQAIDNKRPNTDADVQKYLDQLVLRKISKVYIDDRSAFTSDDQISTMDATEQQLSAAYFKAASGDIIYLRYQPELGDKAKYISPSEMTRIEGILRAEGLPVTNYNRIEIWKANEAVFMSERNKQK